MLYHLVLLFKDEMSKVIPIKDETGTEINKSKPFHPSFLDCAPLSGLSHH